MTKPATAEPQVLHQVLGSLRAALKALDAADAPAEVGAHLDLTICRLDAAVGGKQKQSPDIDEQGSEAAA